jgi:hypothetical protein
MAPVRIGCGNGPSRSLSEVPISVPAPVGRHRWPRLVGAGTLSLAIALRIAACDPSIQIEVRNNTGAPVQWRHRWAHVEWGAAWRNLVAQIRRDPKYARGALSALTTECWGDPRVIAWLGLFGVTARPEAA